LHQWRWISRWISDVTALVPSNVLSLDIPSAQRFGFCADPPERVSASIVGSRQPSTTPSSSAARTAVVERFSRITSEIRRIDRIDAKLMSPPRVRTGL